MKKNRISEDAMFTHIGRKIKTLAKVLCWIGIVLFILAGLAMIAYGLIKGEVRMIVLMSLAGIATGGVGALLSWVCSFLLYGFGQLVDKTEAIECNTRPDAAPAAPAYEPAPAAQAPLPASEPASGSPVSLDSLSAVEEKPLVIPPSQEW